MTKTLSLLNYMKTHNKDNPTFFDLKELSNHLKLDENETLKILKKAKKLGYIKASPGLISNDVAISSQYYITEVGINEVKNNFRNKLNIFLEQPIMKFITLITVIYALYEIIIKYIG